MKLGRRMAVVVVALVLAGCGSSDDTGKTTSSAATATTPKSASSIEGEAMARLPRVAAATQPGQVAGSMDASQERAFLSSVFHDAEAMWTREFAAAGLEYTPARFTIFHDEVHTACGTQSAQVGPFYCPANRGVYLDTRFFDALGRSVGVKLGAFARAYVVAHEVAHHVQVLLGITTRVRAADEQDPAGTNARSVRLELQADCLAGIWKHATYQRGQLTNEDFADALRAAAVVGDDFQQRRATGTVTPEDWTHGSSEQRQHWLTTGFERGEPGACDTFGS
jgi:uncharacterized protein